MTRIGHRRTDSTGKCGTVLKLFFFSVAHQLLYISEQSGCVLFSMVLMCILITCREMLLRRKEKKKNNFRLKIDVGER